MGAGHVFERRAMLPRQNPTLEWKARGVRRDGYEVLVRQDHARFAFDLLANHVAEDAALLFVVVVFGAVDFLAHAARHDGQGDQLGVRVLERAPAARRGS